MKMKLSLVTAALLLSLLAPAAHASPTKGTMYAFPVVQPHSSVMFSNLEFRGSEVTTISVTGKGKIYCALFNSKHAMLAECSGEDTCKIQVTPKQTEQHTVLVTNTDTKLVLNATVLVQ